MRVKTPNVRRRSAQRYSQEVMMSTALSRCRWQNRQRMAGLMCLTLSRLLTEAAGGVREEAEGGVSDSVELGEMT